MMKIKNAGLSRPRLWGSSRFDARTPEGVMVTAPGARGIQSPYAVDVRAGRLDAFHVADIHLYPLLVIASPPESRTTPAIGKVVDILAQLSTTMSEQAEFRLNARSP
ncbi:MAG: hypothetical protein H6930_13830 [Rhodoferax sp.]|nr:hypothetical protein [Rhodoferax sp.]